MSTKIVDNTEYTYEFHNPETILIRYDDLVIDVNPWDLLEHLIGHCGSKYSEQYLDKLGDVQSELFAEFVD